MTEPRLILIVGDLPTNHERYGEFLALILDEAQTTVFSCEIVPDISSAARWFAEESLTQPWKERN